MRLLSGAKLNVYAVEMWGSLFFKILAIACSFILLPLMLSYLGGAVVKALHLKKESDKKLRK